ncbi:MAG: hypothetical protein IPO37_04975 [Saprospiraceae bacterium]|nr:hypothetical protein [Saprospiraceae bacterium]
MIKNIKTITFDDGFTKPVCNGSTTVIKIASVEGFFATGNTIGTLNEHFTFKWSNGNTNSGINNANAGTHTVTVTQRYTGCSKTASYEVKDMQLTVSNVLQPIHCQRSTATISLNVHSPVFDNMPVTYLWSTGQNTSTITDLSPGNFCYTVTSALNNNCKISSCIEVKPFTGDSLIILTKKRNTCFCQNGSCNGVLAAKLNTDGTSISYQWFSGNQLISTAPRIVDLCAGTYVCKITFTPAGSTLPCTVEKSFEIVSEYCSDKLQIFLTNFANVQDCGSHRPCRGFLEVEATFDEPITCTWSGPNGFSANTFDIYDLCPGDYTITILNDTGCFIDERQYTICCCLDFETDTGSSIEGCKSATTPYVVGEVVNATTSTSNDGRINLTSFYTGSFFISVEWSGPNGFSSYFPSIQGLKPGQYNLRWTDGCHIINQSYMIGDESYCKTYKITVDGTPQCILSGFTSAILIFQSLLEGMWYMLINGATVKLPKIYLLISQVIIM